MANRAEMDRYSAGMPVPVPGNHKNLQASRPQRIFIVEDELVFAEDLREILEGYGYCVCGNVPSAEEALVAIPKASPDLVLVDIVLSGEMSGIELADALHKTLDVPVIYLTSNSEDKTVARAKNTLPYGYIPKPFDERVLFSTVEIALFRHQADKRIEESEARYRTFVENIQGIAYRYDDSRTLAFIHGAVEKISGYPREDFTTGRRSWAEIIHPEDRDAIHAPDQADNRDIPCALSREYRIVRKDGEIRWIHDLTRVLYQAPDFSPSYEGMIYDITSLKVLEEDLRKACDIRTLILLMSGHFFQRVVHKKLSGKSWSEQQILSDAVSELLSGIGFEMGVHLISLFERNAPEGELPRITEKLRCVNPNQVPPVDLPAVSDYAYTSQGFARWDESMLRGCPIFGSIADFPQKEQHFFPDPSVTSLVMVPVMHQDRFWGFIQGIYFNTSHDWTDYEISSMQIAADIVATILASGPLMAGPGEVPDLPCASPPVIPKDLLMDAAADIVFVSDDRGKILHMNRSGLGFFGIDGVAERNSDAYKEFEEDIREYAQEISPLQPALAPSPPRGLDLTVRDRLVCLDLTLSVLRASGPDHRLFLGIARDVTAQRTFQRRQHKIQNKLRLMQKIFRHDLNNRITAILGYLSLLKKEEPNEVALEFIGKEERIVDSIRTSLSFTRAYENLGEDSAAWICVNEAFAAAWAGLAPGQVRLDLPEKAPEVFADPLIGNVFFNLLENSLRHGGEKLSAIRVTFRFSGDDLVLLY